MLMPLLVTLTLVAQTDAKDSSDQEAQSFAERLKAAHELKKPEVLDDEDEIQDKESHAARSFQVRMTQAVARRR